MTTARQNRFSPLPEGETLVLAWPTPNRHLHDRPRRFFATTRANAEYGMPGWTRDCGNRFHRGCDIAPVHVTRTGRETVVLFSDCETGTEYESAEPTFEPHDEVYAVCGGNVVEDCDKPRRSDLGRHVVIAHCWPCDGERFYTLYGHLAELAVGPGQSVAPGQPIGIMGTSSRSEDARNWLAIAPHLHFEVWNADRQPMDPVAFLKRYLPSQDK